MKAIYKYVSPRMNGRGPRLHVTRYFETLTEALYLANADGVTWVNSEHRKSRTEHQQVRYDLGTLTCFQHQEIEDLMSDPMRRTLTLYTAPLSWNKHSLGKQAGTITRIPLANADQIIAEREVRDAKFNAQA